MTARAEETETTENTNPVSELTDSVQQKLTVETSPEEDSKVDDKPKTSMLRTPVKAKIGRGSLCLQSPKRTQRLGFLTKAAKHVPVTVVGPSGVGKGTLLGMLRKKYPGVFSVCVSHTTRNKRPGDIDGVHYNFVTRDAFEDLIRAAEFVEYAEVHGNYYGTSFGGVQKVADAGQVCLLELDYQGALAIRDAPGMGSKFLFITLSGGYEELEQRIRKRGGETDEAIAKRLKTAKAEFEFLAENKDLFNAIVSNDDLNVSFPEVDNAFQEWFPHIKELAKPFDLSKEITKIEEERAEKSKSKT